MLDLPRSCLPDPWDSSQLFIGIMVMIMKVVERMKMMIIMRMMITTRMMITSTEKIDKMIPSFLKAREEKQLKKEIRQTCSYQHLSKNNRD